MNLYFRLLWTLLTATFKPRVAVGETITMKFRVWPHDLDVNGHMNNGRYMTIADLATIEYFSRNGFLPLAFKRGWRPVLGGSMISFRRGLKPFKAYTLHFSVVCWDERWSYLRFEFVQAGQIMAVGYAKGAVIGRQGIVTSSEAYASLGMTSSSPPFPESVKAWIKVDQLLRA